MGTLNDWLWRVAITKGIKRGLAIIGVILTTGKTDYVLKQYGVTIDPTLMAASLYAAFEAFRNWLKVKKGVTWL